MPFSDVDAGLKILGGAIGIRELLRSAAWTISEQAYIPRGKNGRMRDHRSLGVLAISASILSMEFLWVGYEMAAGRPLTGATSNPWLDLGLISVGLWSYGVAGRGPTGTTWKGYSDVMWNYPSKVSEGMAAADEIVKKLGKPVPITFPTYEEVVGPNFKPGKGKAPDTPDGPS
jgi:hypothetical protein